MHGIYLSCSNVWPCLRAGLVLMPAVESVFPFKHVSRSTCLSGRSSVSPDRQPFQLAKSGSSFLRRSFLQGELLVQLKAACTCSRVCDAWPLADVDCNGLIQRSTTYSSQYADTS